MDEMVWPMNDVGSAEYPFAFNRRSSLPLEFFLFVWQVLQAVGRKDLPNE
jgi:hypothetical protein